MKWLKDDHDGPWIGHWPMLVMEIEMLFQEAQDCAEGAERPLAELNPEERAVIREVDGSGPMFVRLLEMGFVPGVHVKMIKRAPLGDPLELQLHGYHVSLRRAEAGQIRVLPQVNEAAVEAGAMNEAEAAE